MERVIFKAYLVITGVLLLSLVVVVCAGFLPGFHLSRFSEPHRQADAEARKRQRDDEQMQWLLFYSPAALTNR